MTYADPHPAHTFERLRLAAGGGLRWRWPAAAWAAAGVLPAFAVIASGHASRGIALAVGLLPVGLVGLRPRRRARPPTALVGVAFALFVLIGSLLSRTPATAVAGIFALPLLISLVRLPPSMRQVGLAVLVPAVAIGLSFGEFSDALSLAWAMALGAIWMTALSLAAPNDPLPPPPRPLPPVDAGLIRRWGLLLGAAAATATLVGVLVDSPHLGWAPTAALLVMRPQRALLERRGIARIVSTVLGAMAAIASLQLDPGFVVLGVAVAIVVIASIATRTSRWYVTAAGTSFLVLTLLLYGAPDATVDSTFWSRVGASLIGVGIAAIFGLVVPLLLAARAREQR